MEHVLAERYPLQTLSDLETLNLQIKHLKQESVVGSCRQHVIHSPADPQISLQSQELHFADIEVDADKGQSWPGLQSLQWAASFWIHCVFVPFLAPATSRENHRRQKVELGGTFGLSRRLVPPF